MFNIYSYGNPQKDSEKCFQDGSSMIFTTKDVQVPHLCFLEIGVAIGYIYVIYIYGRTLQYFNIAIENCPCINSRIYIDLPPLIIWDFAMESHHFW